MRSRVVEELVLLVPRLVAVVADVSRFWKASSVRWCRRRRAVRAESRRGATSPRVHRWVDLGDIPLVRRAGALSDLAGEQVLRLSPLEACDGVTHWAAWHRRSRSRPDSLIPSTAGSRLRWGMERALFRSARRRSVRSRRVGGAAGARPRSPCRPLTRARRDPRVGRPGASSSQLHTTYSVPPRRAAGRPRDLGSGGLASELPPCGSPGGVQTLSKRTFSSLTGARRIDFPVRGVPVGHGFRGVWK